MLKTGKKRKLGERSKPKAYGLAATMTFNKRVYDDNEFDILPAYQNPRMKRFKNNEGEMIMPK
jgi:hypothetical protein